MEKYEGARAIAGDDKNLWIERNRLWHFDGLQEEEVPVPGRLLEKQRLARHLRSLSQQQDMDGILTLMEQMKTHA
ncbi:MAG: hypothetical protein CME24_10090 [Gemmatimonadetes bacterium]|nr:hypothetical protein [Gemmatimonadota bacterium]